MTDPQSAIHNPQSEIVNILMVDDRPENLMTLESVLTDLGQNLVGATSGEQALRALLKQDFAVILLDVQMPEMDGFETAALIRARERSQHTPIIFLTAIGKSDEFVFKGYTAGAVDYIIKPIVPEILRAKVSVFVDLYQMRQQIKRQAEQLAASNEQLAQQVAESTRLNRELGIINKELESFSYSVSHDLRAPLRSIDSFSQMLLEDYLGKLDAQGQDCLQRVRAATERMGQLIEDLLKLSRVTRAEMRHAPVDLSVLAKTIASNLKQAQPERQVEFVITDGLTATGDAGLLQVVMENLLGNAWKYTAKHPTARIEFGIIPAAEGQGSGGAEAQPSGGGVISPGLLLPRSPAVFFVRDDGAGFDMAHAAKLFVAFQRLHSPNDFPGTGIGLATVQRIIHRHGGRVWAEGAVEKGATFYFTLGGKVVGTNHPTT